MANRIPAEDAFAFYLQLGAGRSYSAVATKYGVSKRAVTKLAARCNWQDRIDAINAKAQKVVEERAGESIANVTSRHLRTVRFLESKAIQALRDLPVRTAGEAARLLDVSMRQERDLLCIDDEVDGEDDDVERDPKLKAATDALNREFSGWRNFFSVADSELELNDWKTKVARFEELYRQKHPEISQEVFRTTDRSVDFMRWTNDGMVL